MYESGNFAQLFSFEIFITIMSHRKLTQPAWAGDVKQCFTSSGSGSCTFLKKKTSKRKRHGIFLKKMAVLFSSTLLVYLASQTVAYISL